MTTSTGIKLDMAIKERLQRLGKQLDRSPHWLMKHAIIEFLEKKEREQQEKHEDAARWQQFMQNGVAVSHQAVDDWMNKEIKDIEQKLGNRP